MRDYEELLKAGNKAQLEKLKENKHKKGFDEISIPYAYGRMKEEMSELFKARGTENIRLEAADVANFAHMIILKCDKMLANKR